MKKELANVYKRILVPLNGSKNDEVVLPHVVEIANGRNIEIVLLPSFNSAWGRTDCRRPRVRSILTSRHGMCQ